MERKSILKKSAIFFLAAIILFFFFIAGTPVHGRTEHCDNILIAQITGLTPTPSSSVKPVIVPTPAVTDLVQSSPDIKTSPSLHKSPGDSSAPKPESIKPSHTPSDQSSKKLSPSPEASPSSFISPKPLPSPTSSPDKAIAEEKPQGAVVTMAGKPMFALYAKLGPYSPPKRAEAISHRLNSIIKDTKIHPDDINVVEEKWTTNIMAGKRILVTLSDKDAKPEKRTRLELANEYKLIIQITLEEARNKLRKQRMVKGTVVGIVGCILLIILIFISSKLSPAIHKKLHSWRGKWIRSIKIQNLDIISDKRLADLMFFIFKFLRWVVILTLIYILFDYVSDFFPETEGISESFSSSVSKLLFKLWTSISSYLPSFLFVLLMLIATRYILRFVRFIFDEVKKGTITIPGFYEEWLDPTQKIIRGFIIVIAIVIILPYLPGYSSPAFRAISIFIGVIFSLGSTSLISHIVAGVVLTYTRAFKVGDRVKIANVTGDVIEKSLLATRLRTIKNVDISIPNSQVLSGPITNYSSLAEDYGLILHKNITIGYDAPWRQVHELLINAATEIKYVLDDPKPFVLQKSLDDFYVSYEINAYTNHPELMDEIYSELHENIQDKFNEAGVEIMSSHYSSLRDGNEITIPEDKRPKDYTPPPFNIFTR
ncbi:MAG: mechanosensitive ion channel [Candidatus Eremiobacteraeota bacterium]|nr:mechanosensitive ion channel [Candidatus Eremiobacteraeota bacterium]